MTLGKLLGAYGVVVLVAIMAWAAAIAGIVWIAVKVLQWTGVL